MSNETPSLGRPAPVVHPIQSVLQERWSPRAFTDQAVAAEDLRSLFEAARWAPSCFNEQPWRFLVATRDDEEAHARLAATLVEKNRRWAAKAPVIGIACASGTFTRGGKDNPHARHDLGQALACLTVEATARGLAVHQMAGFDAEAARDACGLPEGVEAVTAFVVGRRAAPETLPEEFVEAEGQERSRKAQGDFVFGARWEEPPAFA